jgi:hypothetical protein
MSATYIRGRWPHELIAMLGAAFVILDGAQATPTRPASQPATSPAGSRAARPTRAELESQFATMLTGVTLRGSWQMTRSADDDGLRRLSEPLPESYTIISAVKAREDWWTITARIQFADKDLTLPVTVRVVWAEDTPIITLDEITLPVLGTYSARVLIYRGFYSGTWFGGDHGGVLSGQIMSAAASAPAQQSDLEQQGQP